MKLKLHKNQHTLSTSQESWIELYLYIFLVLLPSLTYPPNTYIFLLKTIENPVDLGMLRSAMSIHLSTYFDMYFLQSNIFNISWWYYRPQSFLQGQKHSLICLLWGKPPYANIFSSSLRLIFRSLFPSNCSLILFIFYGGEPMTFQMIILSFYWFCRWMPHYWRYRNRNSPLHIKISCRGRYEWRT